MFTLTFDIQKIYDYFINELNSLSKLYIPVARFKPSIKQPRHITNMAKQKRNLYRKLKLDLSLKQKYKLLSQEYDKLVSNWHDKIESKVCENRNASSFYKYANKKFKCNVVISPLQTKDNRLITEDDNKVELFNKYFQSVLYRTTTYY